MYIWVIYDIQKNKTRSRVARRCKYFGLNRVQKSVFLGKVKRRWQQTLYRELAHDINHRTDRLFLVPMRGGQLKKVLEAGAPPSIQQCVHEQSTRFI